MRFILIFFILLVVGCLTVEDHDEYLGAQIANAYLRLNFVEKDFQAAESLVYSEVFEVN